MAERREAWARHASLDSPRAMFLAETSGVLDECVPVSLLQCHQPWARSLERSLRDLIFRYESVGDDFVVEPRIRYGWFIEEGDYGVKVEHHRGDNDGKLGSFRFERQCHGSRRPVRSLRFEAVVDREHAQWATLRTVFKVYPAGGSRRLLVDRPDHLQWLIGLEQPMVR